VGRSLDVAGIDLQILVDPFLIKTASVSYRRGRGGVRTKPPAKWPIEEPPDETSMWRDRDECQ
jgi:hypothetical protein